MKEIHISLHQDSPEINEPIHACIGYFDGIHIGHRQLIQAVVKHAKEQGGAAALITFDPDPWAVIKGLTQIAHLTSMEQRKQIAAQLGVEYWIILDFTEEMAALSVAEFHEQILYPLPLATLVCGYDFHYAHYGKGDSQSLQAQNRFTVQVIEQVQNEAQKISSTRIEQCIKEGKIEKANELLSRPYTMTGIVVHGLKNGRKMGYPTVNLQPDTAYVMPKEGVYVGLMHYNGNNYHAMINVGSNPTVQSTLTQRIEAHVFDFDEMIYDRPVAFSFLHYLRGDFKFQGLEQLKQQLQQDEAATLAYFNKHSEEAYAFTGI
ncbi:MAG: riboflavin biosynthesis protein RibF [Erysipelotrichaceae bacterium]|nr:riboflavin biosynthesis protein RibF [Erysipelotrichaceae bacterium]